MGHTSIYYDLLDAFKQQGCPVCRLTERAVSGWLDSVSYESVNDPGVREKLRASYGFRNTHAYQWLGQRDLLGTAIIYHDLLGKLAEALSRLQPHSDGILAGVTSLLSGESHSAAGSEIAPSAMCPVCQAQNETEQAVAGTLLDGLLERDFLDAYAQSESICMPHLNLALSRSSGESFQTLVRVTVGKQRLLQQQLQEIIRKHDYRFNREPQGEEQGAGVRAVRHVVGHQGIRGMDLSGAGR